MRTGEDRCVSVDKHAAISCQPSSFDRVKTIFSKSQRQKNLADKIIRLISWSSSYIQRYSRIVKFLNACMWCFAVTY